MELLVSNPYRANSNCAQFRGQGALGEVLRVSNPYRANSNCAATTATSTSACGSRFQTLTGLTPTAPGPEERVRGLLCAPFQTLTGLTPTAPFSVLPQVWGVLEVSNPYRANSNCAERTLEAAREALQRGFKPLQG